MSELQPTQSIQSTQNPQSAQNPPTAQPPQTQPSQPQPPQKITRSLTPEAVATMTKFGWDFFKAGVLIVDEWAERRQPDGDPAILYMLMREAKVKEPQPDGTKKWVLSDKGKWNLPCGRVQLGETLEAAAFREGREETGYELQSRSFNGAMELCHVGFRADPDNPYIIAIFTAAVKEFLRNPDPEEVAEIGWFTYRQITELRDQGLLRNPELVMGSIEGFIYHNGHLYNPIQTYAAKN